MPEKDEKVHKNTKTKAYCTEDESERFERLKGCILRVCELAGYKLVGELVVKDRKTGKIWY